MSADQLGSSASKLSRAPLTNLGNSPLHSRAADTKSTSNKATLSRFAAPCLPETLFTVPINHMITSYESALNRSSSDDQDSILTDVTDLDTVTDEELLHLLNLLSSQQAIPAIPPSSEATRVLNLIQHQATVSPKTLCPTKRPTYSPYCCYSI